MEKRRRHEVELFNGCNLEAESDHKWKMCTKNPGHQDFISVSDFSDNYLTQLQNTRSRELLRSLIDFTVRLRVYYTSSKRPDEDEYSVIRGTCFRRTGSGFIDLVTLPEFDKPCPCVECDGKVVKKHWKVTVSTARHVVYNTEEAKKTKVDLFLDDENSERDGRMKSVWGVEMEGLGPDSDSCSLTCVICDEDLGERIESAFYHCEDTKTAFLDFSGLDLPTPKNGGQCEPALIVSHPHGQPKKITVGEMRENPTNDMYIHYTIPTCPGSSGAPVLRLKYGRGWDREVSLNLFFPPVHSGSVEENTDDPNSTQINFGWEFFSDYS